MRCAYPPSSLVSQGWADRLFSSVFSVLSVVKIPVWFWNAFRISPFGHRKKCKLRNEGYRIPNRALVFGFFVGAAFSPRSASIRVRRGETPLPLQFAIQEKPNSDERRVCLRVANVVDTNANPPVPTTLIDSHRVVDVKKVGFDYSVPRGTSVAWFRVTLDATHGSSGVPRGTSYVCCRLAHCASHK